MLYKLTHSKAPESETPPPPAPTGVSDSETGLQTSPAKTADENRTIYGERERAMRQAKGEASQIFSNVTH